METPFPGKDVISVFNSDSQRTTFLLFWHEIFTNVVEGNSIWMFSSTVPCVRLSSSDNWIIETCYSLPRCVFAKFGNLFPQGCLAETGGGVPINDNNDGRNVSCRCSIETAQPKNFEILRPAIRLLENNRLHWSCFCRTVPSFEECRKRVEKKHQTFWVSFCSVWCESGWDLDSKGRTKPNRKTYRYLPHNLKN